MSMEEEHDDLARTAESLRLLLTSDHPGSETTLVSYVDGALDAEEREWVEEHLAGCSTCRDDVANLRSASSWTKSKQQHVTAVWWLFAAALASVTILSLVVTRVQRQVGPALMVAHHPTRTN